MSISHKSPPLSVFLSASIFVVGFALWLYTVITASIEDIGELGLIQVLQWPFVLAMVLIAFSLVLDLWHRRPSQHLAFKVSISAILINLTPFLVEITPRYTFSYKSFGFGEHINQVGSIDPNLFYLNWPSFHIWSASLLQFTQLDSERLLVLFTFFGELLLLLGVYLIAQQSLKTPQAAWTAVIITLFIQQTIPYFVPYTFATFIFLLLCWLTMRQTQGSLLSHRFIMIMLLILLTTLHLLTAIVASIFIFLVSIFRQLSPKRMQFSLFIIAAVLLTGWQFYVIESWTLGIALPKLISTIRGSLVHETVGGVYSLGFGGSLGHSVGVWAKLVFALTVSILALVGFLMSLYQKKVLLIPVLGVVASASIVIIGAYGGEIASRMYGYGLPFFAVLIAYLWHMKSGRIIVSGAIMVFALLSPILLFGNELIDYVRPSELAALRSFQTYQPDDIALLVSPERIWPMHYAKTIYGAKKPSAKTFKVDGKLFNEHRAFIGLESLDNQPWAVQVLDVGDHNIQTGSLSPGFGTD